MNRTVEQRRAAFALAFIETIEQDKEKFSTHIHKSPSLILQCGLGQALAFLLADAEGNENKPSKKLYNTLQQWLCGAKDENHPMRLYTNAELINALVNGSRSDYFRAQEEAVMLLNWLNKFGPAKL